MTIRRPGHPMPMRRAMLAIVALLVVPSRAAAPATPGSGGAALEAMRAAYGGRWYRTLTFVQETRKRGPDGKETREVWYESLRHTDAAGTQLRIDTGAPRAGNGVIYTATETRRFSAGKQTESRQGGNALLPLIEGVYLQPIERTTAELAPTGIDLARPVLTGTWEERPVWILGAASSSDHRSPQIWVDVERKVVVRALLPPIPGAPMMDVRIERFVPVGGAWLGTRCEFLVDGKLVQAEDYSDWKAGVELPDALFDPEKFGTTPHWTASPAPGR